MRNWRHTSGMMAIAAIPMITSSVHAQELTIQPRVSIGSQYYKVDFDGGDVDAEVTYAYGGLGVTGQYGNFFTDLYGQTNLTEGEDDQGNVNNTGLDRDTVVNRSEINLTAGYAFTRNIAAFGGLKYATNELENDFSNGNSVDIETTYFGPFGGLALTFPIASLGALSVNGAVAYLDGEQTVENELNGNIDFEGTAIGYSFGIGWAGNFGQAVPGLGYGVGFDYTASEFDLEDGSNDDLYDETTARLRFDLKYRL